MVKTMDGLYDNIKRERKTKKDRGMWLGMVLLAGVFAASAALVIWFMGYHGRFSEFVGNLSDSTTYAYENNSLTAEVDGKMFRVSEENMYGIFAYLSLNKSGRESRKIPEGEPVILDYGDGTVMKLWDVPGEEGRHYLFIQYMDAEGGSYSYISFKTTLEAVIARYLTFGNEEIGKTADD